MNNPPAALLTNIQFLQQGIDLLESINDDLYSLTDGPFNKSSVGRHFRHIIEHYVSLIDANYCGEINYDLRARDLQLELDRAFMITSMQNIVASLKKLAAHPNLVLNRVQIVSNNQDQNGEFLAGESSVLRELQFLVSHTVHHYALIGFILKSLGVEPKENFGVAPSTLVHEQQKNTVDNVTYQV